jgi:hypothetical protein
MYIVSFIKNLDDKLVWDFFQNDNLEDAKSMYEGLLSTDTIYSVSISAVMQSTDYNNAPEFASLQLEEITQ